MDIREAEVRKLLEGQVLVLQGVYELLSRGCPYSDCYSCRHNRLQLQENFRDFRHSLAALVVDSSELHGLVMNWPFSVVPDKRN